MSEMELKNEAGASQKGISAAEHCGGSRLSELLRKYCPGGVEYRPLGEVTLMKRGTSATKGMMQNGSVPVISGGRQPAFYCDKYNRIGDTITVAGSGAGAGYVQYWNEPIFVCDAFSIQGNDKLLTKYVYYYLTSIQEKIYSTKKGGGVPHVHISSIANFEIPLPPMPVQEEIVRILDRFTELQAELQAELQKRKLQYNYYLDNLLNFNRGGYQDKVKWMKMSEIGTFYSGLSGKSKEDFQNGNAKFITYVNVFNHPALITDVVDSVRIFDGEKQNTVQYGDLLFTGSSETPDECGMCSVLTHHIEEKLYLNSFCFGFRFNDLSGINPDFMKFLFRSSAIRKLICRTANGVTRYNVSKKEFAKIVIPIPTITVQNEIVAILDKFYALLGDLTAGLPAEIEKRRQQYEYYRDKLLTFKRI